LGAATMARHKSEGEEQQPRPSTVFDAEENAV